MSILKSYLGLVVVIVLWVCIWSFIDAASRKYFKKDFHKRMMWMIIAIVIFSFILIEWFPEQMML